MGMPSERQAIWNMALECASRRSHKYCENEFGCIECNDCKYNLYAYTNAEPAKVRLLMFEAEGAVYDLRSSIRSGTVTLILFILFILAIPVAMYWFLNSDWANGPLDSPSKPAVEAKYYGDDEGAIQSTLKKVATDMKHKKDVNKDGKVNCIDAALLFYRYYPDKNKVRVYWNCNEAKDFNHLFNLVLVKGEWIGVEPQAKFCGYTDTYRMKPIWKDQYDYRLNRDVTDSWLQYLN